MISQTLETQEGEVIQLDNNVNEDLQVSVEKSRSLRAKFGFLLTSLLSAAKNLALNQRNYAELMVLENLLVECYVVLVKMGFQRVSFQQAYLRVTGRPSNTKGSRVSTLSGSPAALLQCTPNTLATHLNHLEDDIAALQVTLVDYHVPGGQPLEESLSLARKQLEKSTDQVITLIQKLLLFLKTTSKILGAETLTLTTTVSQSANTLATLGQAYLSILSQLYSEEGGGSSGDLLQRGNLIMENLAKKAKEIATFSETYLEDLKRDSAHSCKSVLAAQAYEIARSTKELLAFLQQ